MKRINRKKLIEELESLRWGIRTAYDFMAKTKCQKATMRAHHHFANYLVQKYGGEPVEDIEKEKESPRSKSKSGAAPASDGIRE